MQRPINSRSMDDIQADIDQKLAQMQKITSQVKAEKRDLTADEVAAFDTIDCELRVLNNEKAKAERDSAQLRGLTERIASGDLAVPDFLKAGSQYTGAEGLRSKEGKPIAVAVGPKQRLNANPPRGYLFGELCRAAAVGVSPFSPPEVRAALTSDDNSKGGYAVPDSWLTGWIDRAVEVSSIAPFCTRALMDGASLNITTITARPTVQTKAENAKFADTTMSFGSSRLLAFTAGAIMSASLELLEDSPNAGQQIEAVTIRGLIDWMNSKLLNGTGSEEPTGILNRGDIPTGESTGDITWDAIADGVTVLRNAIYTPNVCVVSPDVFNALHLQRENTEGDGLYLARPEHLRDLNIIASTHCPDDKIVMGDFSQWFIGIRQGARVDVSQEAGEAFERNQMLIRPKVRMDWVPTHTAAFYILDDVTIPS
jgi:HK97 family phage major capsid protein